MNPDIRSRLYEPGVTNPDLRTLNYKPEVGYHADPELGTMTYELEFTYPALQIRIYKP